MKKAGCQIERLRFAPSSKHLFNAEVVISRSSSSNAIF